MKAVAHQLPTGDGISWIPDDTFAKRLWSLRRDKNLTQEEAANLCDINPKTWAKWELGAKPRDMAETAQQIFDHLLVDKDWLMWGYVVRNRWASPPALRMIPGGLKSPPDIGQMALPFLSSVVDN